MISFPFFRKRRDKEPKAESRVTTLWRAYEAARDAYRGAQARGDTRTIHTTQAAMRDAWNAILAHEVSVRRSVGGVAAR
jgi:hypothetical protein